jgi:putative ABC transport system permease protein
MAASTAAVGHEPIMRDSRLEQVRVPWRFAWRELRGGFQGLPIFIACLALGVAAIAGVGSLSSSVVGGLRADARVLLGGDVEIRRTHRPIDAQDQAWLTARAARISNNIQMRAMAEPGGGGRRALVELKAVDAAYPLFGAMTLDPPMPLDEALAGRGAVVERALLSRLGIGLGAEVEIGDARFVLRAVIEAEPDRLATAFSLGPRLMIADEDLAATGLVQPGSLIRYYSRLALPPEVTIQSFVDDLEQTHPAADWRVRDARNAQPGFRRFVTRLTLYLVLVGLTALLVGGIGVAGAARGHLESRTTTIAILKCLGAPNGVIFRTYLFQIAALGAAGTVIGLLVGGALPMVLTPVLHGVMPVDSEIGLYWKPLLAATAFGLLTACAFTLWPLARACEVPAAGLFRSAVMPLRRWPSRRVVAATGMIFTALAALAVFTARDITTGGWFVIGAAGSVAVFQGAAWLLIRVLRRAERPRAAALRIALGGLIRPGAPTANVVLSLGIGLTVLVAIALVEGNLADQVNERVPEKAPAFFFIDIQPDQVAAFEHLVAEVPGVGKVERVPMMRGRITALNGLAPGETVIDPSVRWMVRSDIGFTYAGPRPARAKMIAGQWWPADYAGPPLVSFDEAGARGMGLDIGDTMTFTVLGRTIEAEIANLRRIDWRDFGINFLVVFAPGALDAAPHTHIATAHASAAAEEPLVAAVGARFANVSAIPVRAILASINRIVDGVANALRATAAVTLLAGALVLAGVIAADRRRRLYDAVMLKVLGATRGVVLQAYLLEFALLGLTTAAIASALGTLGAWLFVTEVMEEPWLFLPGRVAVTALGCVVVTTALGFAGTWRALGHKPMKVLRTE